MSQRSKYGWVSGTLICLAITGVSHQPVVIPDIVEFDHQDKFIHALVYGFLATVWLRWFLTFKPPFSAGLWAIALTSAFGITDELHQHFVPGRTTEFLDWLADTLGAVLATVCYLKWPFYRSILESSKRSRRAD
ncbi:MAG: VanZ family protein [Verrucomicrobiota bacterium]